VRLKGRTALITGASRNIGRAIALAFAAEGADLALNTRVNREELDAVAAECAKTGVRVLPVLADVADAGAVEAMVARAVAELGPIDTLVCNAAVRPHKSLMETSFEDWHQVLGINFLNPHLSLYSMRGARKRDYPPNNFYQQPWWPSNRLLEDYFARVSYALTQGKTLSDLTLDELRRESPVFEQDVYQALDPDVAVERRQLPGGPARDPVQRELASLKARLLARGIETGA